MPEHSHLADYDLPEHRHRFATWTAARAVARGFTSTQMVRNAIEASDLRRCAFDRSLWPRTEGQVDYLHSKWVEQILAQFEKDQVFEQTSTGKQRKQPLEKASCYGIAAKIIAIYLKTIIIMGQDVDQNFAYLMHPPIDRTLLQELAKSPELSACKSAWSKINWTQLNKQTYDGLMDSFRKASLDQGGFWRIERFWLPEKEDRAVDAFENAGQP